MMFFLKLADHRLLWMSMKYRKYQIACNIKYYQRGMVEIYDSCDGQIFIWDYIHQDRYKIKPVIDVKKAFAPCWVDMVGPMLARRMIFDGEMCSRLANDGIWPLTNRRPRVVGSASALELNVNTYISSSFFVFCAGCQKKWRANDVYKATGSIINCSQSEILSNSLIFYCQHSIAS
jgi:hypothetical protein